MLVSDYNVQYKTMNNVSIQYPNKKIFIKHSLCHHLPLIFASWFLPYRTEAVVSQHIWTPFSTIPLLSLGNILMEHFAMFIRDVFRVFRKKSKWECRKWSFNDMLHPSSTVQWYWLLHNFTAFLSFSLP
jgi:hypothetical protein